MKIQKIDRKPKKVLRKQKLEENSLICGVKNPASLGCVFYELEGNEVGTRFTAERFHEGHENMMHGGYIAALLDEVMGRAINNAGFPQEKPFVTAEMTTSYLCPVMVGEQMYAFGKVEKREGRRCYARGVIVNSDGVIMAKSTGTYVMVEQAGGTSSENYDGLGTEPLNGDDPEMM